MVAELLTARCPTVVNVPRPERYAVHKLNVCGERSQTMRAKANKDVAQAAALIDYLAENDADALDDAWRDAIARGPGWKRRVIEGARRAAEAFGVVEEPVERLLKRTTGASEPSRF